MKQHSNETLERLIRNQRGLSKMYINDTDKDSQYMAKYHSDIADEYEEEKLLK